jgi:hypothetical protein
MVLRAGLGLIADPFSDNDDTIKSKSLAKSIYCTRVFDGFHYIPYYKVCQVVSFKMLETSLALDLPPKSRLRKFGRYT